MNDVLIYTSVQFDGTWGAWFCTDSEALKNYLKMTYGSVEDLCGVFETHGEDYEYLFWGKGPDTDWSKCGIIDYKILEDFLILAQTIGLELIGVNFRPSGNEDWIKKTSEILSSRQKESPPF